MQMSLLSHMFIGCDIELSSRAHISLEVLVYVAQ